MYRRLKANRGPGHPLEVILFFSYSGFRINAATDIINRYRETDNIASLHEHVQQARNIFPSHAYYVYTNFFNAVVTVLKLKKKQPLKYKLNLTNPAIYSHRFYRLQLQNYMPRTFFIEK